MIHLFVFDQIILTKQTITITKMINGTMLLHQNKLAKAQKMRRPLDTPSLKKFGPSKLCVEKVWAQKMFSIFFRKFYSDSKLKNYESLLSSTFRVERPLQRFLAKKPKPENHSGPLSSTFPVGRLETLTEWKSESVTDGRTDLRTSDMGRC